MKFFKVIIIIIFLGVVTAFVLMGRTDDKRVVSPQLVSQDQAAITSTPTPIPINISQSSNLETETEKLTPEDFSGDFKMLKEEVGKL